MDTTVQYNVHCTYMYLCSGTEPFMSGSGSDFSKRPDLRNPIHISQSKNHWYRLISLKIIQYSTVQLIKKSFVLGKFRTYLVLTLFWPCYSIIQVLVYTVQGKGFTVRSKSSQYVNQSVLWNFSVCQTLIWNLFHYKKRQHLKPIRSSYETQKHASVLFYNHACLGQEKGIGSNRCWCNFFLQWVPGFSSFINQTFFSEPTGPNHACL